MSLRALYRSRQPNWQFISEDLLMKSLFRLNLQFFAVGGAAAGTAAASSEGGSTANTGENATAAAEQRLR